MVRVPVSSSTILSIGYDPESQTLEVEFKKSGVYHYFGVPLGVYDEMMIADSKGKYLNSQIKDRYPVSKI